MNVVELIREHSAEKLGEGVSPTLIKDLEARLDIKLPRDFKEYLQQLNYAELFSDPIYGIHKDMQDIDLYASNKHKEHFNYGFLEIFRSDIDGCVYLRPDTGAVYIGFSEPAAKSFTEFVEKVLA